MRSIQMSYRLAFVAALNSNALRIWFVAKDTGNLSASSGVAYGRFRSFPALQLSVTRPQLEHQPVSVRSSIPVTISSENPPIAPR